MARCVPRATLIPTASVTKSMVPRGTGCLVTSKSAEFGLKLHALRGYERRDAARPLVRGRVFAVSDGTLLNSKSQLSSTTARALKEASSRGVKIVIATGKARPAVMRVFKKVDLAGKDGIVSEFSSGVYLQGLLVYDIQGGEICRRNLDPDVCREAEIMPSVESLLAADEIQKLVFMDTAEGVSTTLRPYWSKATGDRAAVVQTVPDMLELVPPGTSKGSGVKMLLDHLGITPNEIMAIGDGENDVEMLELASLGVCLSNGAEKTKAVANVIGASNNEDGAADAIYRYAF